MVHREAAPSGLSRRYAATWLCLALAFVFFFTANYRDISRGLGLRLDINSGLTDETSYNVASLSTLDDVFPEALKRDEYSCNKDKPCANGACCGSYFGGTTGTCGYGPTYCGADCTSNCNATAECGRDASPPGKTCPLNVCCSQWGFCGSTEEFCSPSLNCQSNCVEHPLPPAGQNGGSVENRVIGYYEAWAARRDCYKFPPGAIPVQGLTHVNFAFAYIEPESFKITTMDSATPESLFTQTADVHTLKSGSENLEVWVSIGGWTFSDNGTATQPVWSNIAASEENRQTFADNLVSFMKQYGFDGVDLDWEYPGAPDRGGKTEDTENFVLMLKTMRATFDAAGGYGITFTIPSSYWYLRWFDLPGLLKYADWVNLMSYDIHGVWDSSNPIGNRVLAHTNLTEIQHAVELLWRVQVPPSKVVLGLGFYGRSFQLEDSSCGSPGCPFKGPAEAGTCTKSPGTLAYFEVMEILEKQKPTVVHDKDSAVKYIQFGADKDQWISYDDEDTFKQKVDWADDIGLGGLMIWSIDQDDTQFSALKGLTGKNLPTFAEALAAQTAASGNWASQNGQNCKMTECMGSDKVGSWGSDWAIAPGGGAFKDNCGGDDNKYIICPVEQMPSSCTWRGGETGCGCHGQCHAGEVTLFHSQHGSRSCCKPGWQAFCCESNTWSHIVEGCYFAQDYNCPADKFLVSYRYVELPGHDVDGSRWTEKQAYCCPLEFKSCHWIGKGYCDDNECADWEIEMLTDEFGDSYNSCARITGRSRVLCCKPPADMNPFLPVPLEKLFPTLPPATSVPNFDKQMIDVPSTVKGEASSPEAFGMVVIDGPQDAVTNLATRDETHLEFLDCDPSTRKRDVNTTYTLRYICMDNSVESNCDAVHEGGAPGTIIKLPEGCGYATYGVVHEIRPAPENVTIPGELLKRAPPNPVVHELDFSYDFSRVKRASSDVYIRIDYGWSDEYWDEIVAGDPITKRGYKRGKNETLDKRFWSVKEDAWRNLLERIRSSDISYQPNLLVENFDKLIYQQDNTTTCGGKSGFMSAKLSGTLSNAIRWGFTMVGTISPTLAFEEAYGFFDSNMDLSGTFRFQGNGELNIAGTTKSADLFFVDISDYSFSHPGIVRFSPNMNVGVTLTGAGAINGNFSVGFLAGSGSTMMVHAPPTLGDMSGDLRGFSVNNAWSGQVRARRTAATPQDGTIFGANLNLRSWMDIEVYNLGSVLAAGKGQFIAQNTHYIRVSDSGTVVNVTEGARQASVEAYSASISKAWEADESSHGVGRASHAHAVFSADAPGQAPSRENGPPHWSGSAILRGNYMSCAPDKVITCPTPGNLSRLIPDLDVDPDNGQPYDKRADLTELLDPRGTGGRRKFTVRGLNGHTFEIWSHTYPNGDNGDFLLGINPNAGFWTLEDPDDCISYTMTEDGDADDGNKYVTEHTVELSYIGQLLSFMLTGRANLANGRTYGIYGANLIDPALLGDNSWFQTPWSQWDPQGSHPYPNLSPLDEAFQILGDTVNPDGFVNAESTLNGFKMRLWNGNAPVAEDTWDANQWSDTSDPARFGEAMSAIRTTVSVFQYLNGVRIHMNDIINALTGLFRRFDEAVNRVSGQTINTREFHLQFYFNVVVGGRLEQAETWVNDRLNVLESVWQARLSELQRLGSNANPQDLSTAQDVLEQIGLFREELDENDVFLMDMTGIHDQPTEP